MAEKPGYEFWFFKDGPINEDLNVRASSSLELLDRLLNWPHYDRFCGLGHGYNGREHFGWHSTRQFPSGRGVNDVEFDVARLHDLEYVEQMVAELWARVAGEGP